jgi:linoleoyl-CoA desaturase
VTTQTLATPAVRPQYPPHSPARAELCRRVESYFERTGLDDKGGARMVVKSLVIFAWVAVSWALLVFWAGTPWTALLLSTSLGLALAGVGFAIQHDGGHGAYSHRPWVNRLSAGALDFLGGSSFLWNQKHNILHHSFTNVEGVDDDIDSQPFLRLAPAQRLRWYHRFQFIYVWPLMGLFFASKWIVFDDFKVWARGKIGPQPIPRPRGWDAVQLVAGKLLFVAWAVAIPLAFRSFPQVAAGFAWTAAVLGITLGTVFQLAHAVDGTAFCTAPDADARLDRPFVEHQLATTADFAPKNRLITWYVGGLNFQVEHHLFPRVGHRHYPAIAEIVREFCRERGLEYVSYDTLWGALRAHLSFLRRMGRGEPVVSAS